MWTRRTFLHSVTGAALMARELSNVKLGAQTNAWPMTPGDLNQFFEVLNKIKDYGFQGFETGFANLRAQFESPETTKRRIGATGLEFSAFTFF